MDAPAGSSRRLLAAVAAIALAATAASPAAQGPASDGRGNAARAYDELLDLNVRDGLVYYRALKGQRGRLDGYISSLAGVAIDAAPRDEQIAFWLNAYNALVLRTVIDHYPIPQRSSDYPPRSIRQIPGAFERQSHRVGGRAVTLDQIEQTVLSGFHDPRVYFALGRGAMGGGRLRSEAYSGSRLETQLGEAAGECVSRVECVEVDRGANQLKVSSIFSWRERDFVAAYAAKAATPFTERSPVERAVLAFAGPGFLAAERELLQRNTFTLVYTPFDWSLNDLTGR